MSAAAAALDELLSEEPRQAALRVQRRNPLDGRPVVLYGAGTLGVTVAQNLRRSGIEPAAFADDTPEKQGSSVAGVPVLPLHQAASRFGDRALFVVTILNPMLRFLDARARLEEAGAAPVASFLELAWQLPEAFLPYYQFEMPQAVLAKRGDILRAARLFADEESRRQFTAHLRFRLHLDYDALPPNARQDYFPAGVLPALGEDCTFVDCGAYDGDTIRSFLAHTRNAFHAVYAFEPDAVNCERLRRYVATLVPEVGRRIHVHCAATGDKRGKARFNSTGNMSAAAAGDGSAEVDVVRVDAIIPSGGRVYVKYDVEGAEWEALRGTAGLLKTTRPLLAVSVYHRPDDLWQLPLYLHSLGLGYRVYLRTQGEDGMDVICYAVTDSA